MSDAHLPSNHRNEPETNRDKVLRGEIVLVTTGRLREMQAMAIAREGIGEGDYHWHWAAVMNELVARRTGALPANETPQPPSKTLAMAETSNPVLAAGSHPHDEAAQAAGDAFRKRWKRDPTDHGDACWLVGYMDGLEDGRRSDETSEGYSQEYAEQLQQALLTFATSSLTCDRVRQFAHKGLLPPVKAFEATTCNHPPEARGLTGCGICGATL